ncbi:hypothetical protein BDZ90DRAFT_233228 [Jaminaea rosea]|uniref:Uncharacterized protein n=1 Tax=Jaminaea rosea TaxID=1569628 RepID=A0A316UMX7_9BASI|nr:hypothetical protein BDZ90DRAFT_233228 [Jaminaea rosea]PWN26619.1 hypothetical protein BDZ90DRAFT_233228 [Jaminaea rosea]
MPAELLASTTVAGIYTPIRAFRLQDPLINITNNGGIIAQETDAIGSSEHALSCRPRASTPSDSPLSGHTLPQSLT